MRSVVLRTGKVMSDIAGAMAVLLGYNNNLVEPMAGDTLNDNLNAVAPCPNDEHPRKCAAASCSVSGFNASGGRRMLSVGFYDYYLLPRIVHFTCGQKPAMKQRQKVVPLASGRVLEIGIGSGLNIPFYDTARVEHLWGLDPSAEMWAIAQKNAAEHHIDAEFIQSGAQSIPLAAAAADTVVMTYTMCTLPHVLPALQEIRRVLKPGGRLLFCEHGRAPDPSVRRWQNIVNPAWRRLGGGCNLNRPIDDLLRQAGFDLPDLQTMYIPGWKPACFNYWGTAV